MARETCHYWDEQLAKCWDSGFTIQEYNELKELPYKSVRRLIRQMKQERDGKPVEDETLKIVELLKSSATKYGSISSVRLTAGGIDTPSQPCSYISAVADYSNLPVIENKCSQP